jgi:hypothetical protein
MVRKERIQLKLVLTLFSPRVAPFQIRAHISQWDTAGAEVSICFFFFFFSSFVSCFGGVTHESEINCGCGLDLIVRRCGTP